MSAAMRDLSIAAMSRGGEVWVFGGEAHQDLVRELAETERRLGHDSYALKDVPPTITHLYGLPVVISQHIRRGAIELHARDWDEQPVIHVVRS